MKFSAYTSFPGCLNPHKPGCQISRVTPDINIQQTADNKPTKVSFWFITLEEPQKCRPEFPPLFPERCLRDAAYARNGARLSQKLPDNAFFLIPRSPRIPIFSVFPLRVIASLQRYPVLQRQRRYPSLFTGG